MASSRAPTNWEEWLSNHPSDTAYDSRPKEVAKLCSLTDEVKNYDILSKSKNIVLLTRAPMREKFQATFFHSVVGLPIVPDDLHYVARLAPKGTGVKLDPKSIFKQTAAMHSPSLVEMLKMENESDLENLVEDTSAQRKKIKIWGTLNPALYKAAKATDMKPVSGFLAVVGAIRASITPNPAAENESEDEMLLRESTPYAPTLRFL